jgi:hypothetical protein
VVAEVERVDEVEVAADDRDAAAYGGIPDGGDELDEVVDGDDEVVDGDDEVLDNELDVTAASSMR